MRLKVGDLSTIRKRFEEWYRNHQNSTNIINTLKFCNYNKEILYKGYNAVLNVRMKNMSNENYIYSINQMLISNILQNIEIQLTNFKFFASDEFELIL